MWIEIDVTAGYEMLGAPEIIAPGSHIEGPGLQALHSCRHYQAGKAGYSEFLIPGCSVAGDQGSSGFPVRNPMPRKCLDAVSPQ
jgi:hypothetical protein